MSIFDIHLLLLVATSALLHFTSYRHCPAVRSAPPRPSGPSPRSGPWSVSPARVRPVVLERGQVFGFVPAAQGLDHAFEASRATAPGWVTPRGAELSASARHVWFWDTPDPHRASAEKEEAMDRHLEQKVGEVERPIYYHWDRTIYGIGMVMACLRCSSSVGGSKAQM